MSEKTVPEDVRELAEREAYTWFDDHGGQKWEDMVDAFERCILADRASRSTSSIEELAKQFHDGPLLAAEYPFDGVSADWCRDVAKFFVERTAFLPSDARVQELVAALERIRDSNGWESSADDLRDAAHTALAQYRRTEDV